MRRAQMLDWLNLKKRNQGTKNTNSAKEIISEYGCVIVSPVSSNVSVKEFLS